MMIPTLQNRKQITPGILQIVIFFLILSIPYNSLWALHIELEPQLSWGLNYEDTTDVTGFINIYSPELNFKVEGPRIMITGHTGLDVRRYVSDKYKVLDETDRDYDIQTTFRLSPRSETTFGATYSRDSNPLRYFTEEQGVESGVSVRQSQVNITKSYSADYQYKLSPKGTLMLAFYYANFSTSVSSGSPVYFYSLQYNYTLNNKNSISLTFGYNNLKFNYAIAEALLNYKLDTYSVSTGFVHQFSETCNLSFNVGWNFSDTKQQQAIFKEDPETGEQIFAGIQSIKSSTTGSNFNLRLEKKYFHTTVSLTGSQSLYTDPETGQTYPTQRLDFNIRYNLTSKLSGSLGWSFYNNKASAGDYNNSVDYEYESNYTSVGISYKYRPNITLSVGYSRVDSQNKKPVKSERISNYAFLQCSFALQRPFIAR